MVISEEDDRALSDEQNKIYDARWEFRRSRIKTSLPEKIVFLIDIHEEMAEPWNNNYETRMVAVKDAIGKFVRRKKNSLLKHLFSLATFQSPEEVNVLFQFTSNEDEIMEGLNKLSAEISASHVESDYKDEPYHKAVAENVDLVAVLNNVCNQLVLPSSMRSSQIPRSNTKSSYNNENDHSNGKDTSNTFLSTYTLDGIVRCILIYGRSREVPIDRMDGVHASYRDVHIIAIPVYIPFLHHPDCYLDILYLHLKVNEENVRCQEIYNVLSALVRRAHPDGESGQVTNFNSFILETHASAIKLATHMAALLAHPVQREEAATIIARMDINSLLAANIRHLLSNENKKK